MQPTLKDISRKAGVSVSTVSDILNKRKASYAEKTRTHVWNIAKSLGYSTNIIARTLTGAKTNLIGILSCSFFMKAHKLELLASSKGYTAQISAHHSDAEKFTKAFQDFSQRRADGLLILNPGMQNIRVLEKIKSKMPIVICSENPVPNYDYIHLLAQKATETAVDYLVSLGHKKIALLSCILYEKKNNARYNGFCEALKKHKIPFDESFNINIGDIEEPYQAGYIRIKEALKKWGRASLPTAVLCSTDEVAMGAVTALFEEGINVPGDISIMGMQNLDASPYARVPITTVDWELQASYLKGMELLIEKIENPRKAFKTIHSKPSIVERASCSSLKTIK